MLRSRSARRGDGFRRSQYRQSRFKGFALSLDAKDEAEADECSTRLSTGGQVTMPLSKTFFSPRFGMVRRQVRRELDDHRRAK